jgi:hypothetical protein
MTATILPQLIHLLRPWQHAYNNSTSLETTVTSVHLAAMLFGGGFAVAADRATLRLPAHDEAEAARHLSELHAIHRPVLLALAVLFASGVALAASDIKTYATTPVFYLKLGLVALLLANGGVLTRVEARLMRAAREGDGARAPTFWRLLRASSWCSLALWTATLVVGVALVNVS